MDRPPHNLPSQPTPLIGREREVATVTARLRDPGVRLLTLTGPGGIGKTRLALRAAEELRAAFPDGVRFVGLAPIRDPELVVSTVAQALGVTTAGDQLPLERLLAVLRPRRMLLVIDNFEQVLPAAALLAGMLEEAPELKLLVTSRSLLGVYGEHTFTVPPLALPHAPGAPPEELTSSAAVRLFIERARAAQADFAVTPDSAATIAEICCRLDGLPLAIELAAARARLLSPPALLARLGLKLLTGGPRTLPARQQTLRGAIDWSYELLDAGERALFARLAVFVGGCTLAMAELVCNTAGDLPTEVINGLQSLLDKSLLRGVTGADDEPRFVMLETIGEYALERLEERGETEALRRAHATHYLALVQLAASHFFGADQQLWFDRMEAELDNLRAALAWSEEANDRTAIGLELAGRLWRFWVVRGHISEGRRWLDVLLARRHTVPRSATWFALHTAGNLADVQGDTAQAVPLWEECLQICRELGNKRFVGHMLNNLGLAAAARGSYDRAAALYEEALLMYSAVANAWGTGLTTRNLGKVVQIRGDYDRARALLEESLRVMRELGDREAVARATQALGSIAFDTQAYDEAAHHLAEAERLFREVGSKPGLASLLVRRGELARQQGDVQDALALLTEGAALQRELGRKGGVARALYALGRVAYEQGDTRAARTSYTESLQLQEPIQSTHSTAELLEAFAALALAEQPLVSATLMGAGSRLRQAIGAPLPPRERPWHQQLVRRLRARLGQATFGAAWLKGQQLSLAQATALAQSDAQLTPVDNPQGGARPEPQARAKRRDLVGLTAREIDVLRLVAQGLTDAEVAEKLVISPRTVNGHLSSIYSKLGVASRTAAARFAIENDLI